METGTHVWLVSSSAVPSGTPANRFAIPALKRRAILTMSLRDNQKMSNLQWQTRRSATGLPPAIDTEKRKRPLGAASFVKVTNAAD